MPLAAGGVLGTTREIGQAGSEQAAQTMTIQLPKELEPLIEEAVRAGRFASVDAAMAEAARLLLREMNQTPSANRASDATTDPILGLMKDDVELIDEIVAEAYQQRQDESWRELDL